jgi:DNA-binding winged helix-turn-helix (wHTH) protein
MPCRAWDLTATTDDGALMEAVRQAREELSFGPFTLVPSERLLTKQGAAVPLGARALDILIALVLRAGVAMDKRALIAQVWPDATVGEGSLRFHIASLRKALGDGENGARYITTLAARGYCFVAPISCSGDRAVVPTPVSIRLPRANIRSARCAWSGAPTGFARFRRNLSRCGS